MALNTWYLIGGTISNTSRPYQSVVAWKITAQDIVNNTSTVVLRSLIRTTSTSYNWQGACTNWSLTLDGQNVTASTYTSSTTDGWTYNSSTFPEAVDGSTYKAAELISTERTFTITHTSNGTKSASLTHTYALDSGGFGPGNVSVSGTLVLDTIPRASLLNSVNNNIVLDTAANRITFNRTVYSSGFYTKLTLNQGATFRQSWDLGTGFVGTASTSVTFAADTITAIYAALPALTSTSSLNFELRTYSDAYVTQIGSTQTISGITGNIPVSVVPSTPTNMPKTFNNTFGGYNIQGKTTITFTQPSVTEYNGSNFVALQVLFESNTYTGSSITTAVIGSSGSLSASIRVQDARGRWSAYRTETIEVQTYFLPRDIGFDVTRAINPGQANAEVGMLIQHNYQAAYIPGNNWYYALWYKHRGSTDAYATYRSKTQINPDGSTNPDNWIKINSETILSFVFDEAKTYDIRLALYDTVNGINNAIYFYDILSTAETPLSIARYGIGVNKVWENGALDVNGDAHISGYAYSTSPPPGDDSFKLATTAYVQDEILAITETGVGPHTHGNITYTGAIGSTGGLAVVTGTNGVLEAGSVAATGIANDAVNNTKLANMAQNTIKGRITASTGDPEDLTATQVRTIINVADGANNYTHPTQTAIDVNATDNGVNVIDRVVVNTAGHVTSVTTRDLSAATTSANGVMSSADKTKLDGIAAGAQVNVATNLTYTAADSNGTVNSSTGTSATLPAATGSLAGLLTAADKTKLDAIAASANNYVHPSGFTSQPAAALTGANVISQVTVNSEGHITGVTSRALTAANVSAAAAVHTHAAADTTSGTFHVDRIPTLNYSKVDFADQNLNTTNSPSFYAVSSRRFMQSADGVPTNNLGSPTLAEMALFQEQFNNKTEFYDITKLTFETYDGSVWTDITTSISDTNKKRFVGGDNSSTITIPHGVNKYRITIRNNSTYVYLNALYMYWSGSGNNTQVHIWKKHDSGSWVQHTSSTVEVNSYPGHLYLPFATIPFHPTGTLNTHWNDVRIEFTPNWIHASNPISLYKMQLWGGYPAGKRTVYSVDEDKVVSFPGGLVANGQTVTLSNDSRLTDARTPVAHNQAFSTITSTPTTLSGYGITDAAPLSHVGATGAAHGAATTSVNGFMSSGDKTKLDGIATGANNYTLPVATSTVLGGIELFSDTVQSVAANSVTTTASRTYGIQVNSAGQAVVNIPWVDTNTTYAKATSSVLGLVEIFSDTVQSVAANSVTTTANRTYGIQLNSADQMVVNIPWTDTVYTHPTGDGNLHVPATGTTNNGRVLTAGPTAGSLSWQTPTTGTVTSVAMTVPTGLSISGTPITTNGTLALSFAAGYSIPLDTTQANWSAAYTHSQVTTGGVHGSTTIGQNLFRLTNPSAVSFLRANADNTVTARSAADFRTDISALSISHAGTGGGAHALVTDLDAGFISPADKTKLDSITIIDGEISVSLDDITGQIEALQQVTTSTAIQNTIFNSATYLTDKDSKENFLVKSIAAPLSPYLNQLWLDISGNTYVFKMWNGSDWINASHTTALGIGAYPNNSGLALEIDIDNLYNDLATTQSSLSNYALVTYVDEHVETARLNAISTIRTDYQSTIDSVQNSFDFNTNYINISPGTIPYDLILQSTGVTFKYNDNTIMSLTELLTTLNTLTVTGSAKMGVHSIEKYNSDITLITWVGE